jgi:hypothetical protein
VKVTLIESPASVVQVAVVAVIITLFMSVIVARPVPRVAGATRP